MEPSVHTGIEALFFRVLSTLFKRSDQKLVIELHCFKDMFRS
jgi:hypothetical protein